MDNKLGYKKVPANKPVRMLTEEAFLELNFEAGKWNFGAVQVKDGFYVIIRAENIEYDILYAGPYETQEKALEDADVLAASFLAQAGMAN